MTYRISKTILDRHNLGDFAARAAAHAVAMKDWRAHMARVKEDEKNVDKVAPIDRHMPLPQPIEHELVQAAVNENDEMDYDLVDDGPSAEQILRAKKDYLLHAAAIVESQALNDIFPVGRRRLLNLQEADIVKRDDERGTAIARTYAERMVEWGGKRKGILKAIKRALVGDDDAAPPAAPNVAGEVSATRKDHETRLLEEQASRRERMDAVHRAAAQAQHDIEDLTAETIDGWTIPDLNKI